MPLPYSFISGDLARSAQVNANFKYLEDLIGADSKPGTIAPQGAFILGPRKTGQLTSEHDTGASGHGGATINLSWNAQMKKVGSTWKYTRVLSSTMGSVLRVGSMGVDLLYTIQRTGDLHTQLRAIWRVGEDTNGKYMFVPIDMAFSTLGAFPTKPSQRRLTTVLLDTPVRIYGMQAVSKGTSILSAYNYGIPRQASAIIINAHVTASWRSGAGMFFFKQEGPNIDRSHNYNGMVAHATITGTGLGMRTGNQGIVPLGTGSYAGKFFVHRTERFEQANVYIIGYLV